MDGRPEMINIALEFFLQAQVEGRCKGMEFSVRPGKRPRRQKNTQGLRGKFTVKIKEIENVLPRIRIFLTARHCMTRFVPFLHLAASPADGETVLGDFPSGDLESLAIIVPLAKIHLPEGDFPDEFYSEGKILVADLESGFHR